MKLALHRSITFWFGILVMGAICWAWVDSMQRNSWVSVGNTQLNNMGSVVTVFVDYTESTPLRIDHGSSELDLGMHWETWGGFVFTRGAGRDSRAVTSVAISDPGPYTVIDEMEASMEVQPKSVWLLCIPHWLLLLTVALPWSALLLWRARRRKRARPAKEWSRG